MMASKECYLLSTRTSQRRCRFDYTVRKHRELLEILKTLPCQVILSGYRSSLYDDLLTGWNTIELQVMNQGGVRTEKLWFNFTADNTYHSLIPIWSGNHLDRGSVLLDLEFYHQKWL